MMAIITKTVDNANSRELMKCQRMNKRTKKLLTSKNILSNMAVSLKDPRGCISIRKSLQIVTKILYRKPSR